MPASYMLRKHLRTMESACRPEAVKERRLSAEAHRRAMVDVRSRFPFLTAENFEDADAYRRERVAFYTEQPSR